MDLELPRLGFHPSQYTDKRVGKGTAYVNQRLESKMRKPSLIQERALLVHKVACQDYLNARNEMFPESQKKRNVV